MSSPITSADFDNQHLSDSLCDSFQEKLLNNDKMKLLLEYMFQGDGNIGPDFATDIFLPMFGQFIGEIKFFPVDPSGMDSETMLKAEGQQVSTVVFAKLFARYGTTFNLDGDTPPSDSYQFFRLPDARSCYLLCAGSNTGFAAANIGASVGEHVGVKISSVTLLAENLPPHKHKIAVDGDDGVSFPLEEQNGRLGGTNWNPDNLEDKVGYTRNSAPALANVEPVAVTIVPPSIVGVYYIVANIKIGGNIL